MLDTANNNSERLSEGYKIDTLRQQIATRNCRPSSRSLWPPALGSEGAALSVLAAVQYGKLISQANGNGNYALEWNKITTFLFV